MNIHTYNKALLNLIIAGLIYLIYSDIQFNSTIKEVDYSNTFISLSALLVFGLIRYNYEEFSELLKDK